MRLLAQRTSRILLGKFMNEDPSLRHADHDGTGGLQPPHNEKATRLAFIQGLPEG
jgi:hypothetical protein